MTRALTGAIKTVPGVSKLRSKFILRLTVAVKQYLVIPGLPSLVDSWPHQLLGHQAGQSVLSLGAGRLTCP